MRFDFVLEICEPMWEMAAHAYFRLKLCSWSVEVFRCRNSPLEFLVNLPFIHITNTLYRRVIDIKTETHNNMTDTWSKVVPVTTGKVFFWKIKIPEPPVLRSKE